MKDKQYLLVTLFALAAGCSEGEMVVAHFPSGQIKSRGHQKGVNVKVGEWTFWYEKGKKRSEGRFVDGVKEGAWTYYSPKGELILSAEGDWYWTELEIADGVTGVGLVRRLDGQRAGPWEYRGFGDLLLACAEDGPGAKWSSFERTDGVKAVGFVIDGRRAGVWTVLYKSGKKREQATYNSKGAVDGLSVQWHENGERKAAGQLVSGRRHGIWTTWHENGQKESACTYEQGKLTGQWSKWHDNSKQWAAGQYANGTPCGRWTIWDKGGRKQFEHTYNAESRDVVEYHDNGAVEGRGAEVDCDSSGRQEWWREHGPWERFYPDGQKRSEGASVRGVLDGLWTRWHPNGVRESQGSYAFGMRTGTWSEWYDDGTRAMTGEWVDDVAADCTEWRKGGALRDGLCAEKYGLGGIEMTGMWRAGKRIGRWTFYGISGETRAQGSYQSGKLSGQWKFWHWRMKPDGKVVTGELRATGRFVEGKREGRWVFWGEDSSRDEVRSGIYKAGVRVAPLDR